VEPPAIYRFVKQAGIKESLLCLSANGSRSGRVGDAAFIELPNWYSRLKEKHHERDLIGLVFSCFLWFVVVWAQTDLPTVKEDFVPSSLQSARPGRVPVGPTHRAMYDSGIVAPLAQSVSVSLGGRDGTKLTKAARPHVGWHDGKTGGIEGFTTTISRLTGECSTIRVHELLGSNSKGKRRRSPCSGPGLLPSRCAHGRVSRFSSIESTNTSRRAFVYTPPEIPTRIRPKRYPVLYLQHGWVRTRTAWSNQGAQSDHGQPDRQSRNASPSSFVMTYGHDE